jgi:hypothetical protein
MSRYSKKKECEILENVFSSSPDITELQRKYLDICKTLIHSKDKTDKMKSFYKLICILKQRVEDEMNKLENLKGEEIKRLLKEYPFIEKKNEDGSIEFKKSEEQDFKRMLLPISVIKHMDRLFDRLWTDLMNDSTEDNLIFKFNIACLVCECIFTEFATNKDVPKIVELKRKGDQPYPMPINILVYNDMKRDILYSSNNIHKDIYKGQFKKDADDKPMNFVIFVFPYLGVSCMLDAWFEHDIWFLAFATRYQTYDGGQRWAYPIHITKHDIGHFLQTPPASHSYKEFYIYCKQEVVNSTILYQIKLLIFWFLHEIDFDFSSFLVSTKKKEEKEIPWDIIEEDNLLKKFSDAQDLFLLLPSTIKLAYKEKLEEEQRLEEEKKASKEKTPKEKTPKEKTPKELIPITKQVIKDYFEAALEAFNTAIKNFIKQKPVPGGKRTKKRRHRKIK